MGKITSRTARAAVTAGLAATLAFSSLPVSAFAEVAGGNQNGGGSVAADASAPAADSSTGAADDVTTADAAAGTTDDAAPADTTDAAADSETPAADAAAAPAAADDTQATGAFEVDGRSFSDFAEAVKEAAKTSSHKVTIKNNVAPNQILNVNEGGVTVTADSTVVYSGVLQVSADNVTVTGIHFQLDPATEVYKQNVIVGNKAHGVTITKNVFTIAPGDPAKGGSGNKDLNPNAVWLENGANGTVVDDNDFSLGQSVNNSSTGINLIGNGTNPITGTKITNNHVKTGGIVGNGTSGTMMFVVGNGNTPAGSYGIVDTTITGNTVKNGTGLTADKSKTFGVSVTATKNTSITDNNSFEGYAAISYSVWRSQGPNDVLTVSGNTMNAYAGINLGTYVTEGGLKAYNNTFGPETKVPYAGPSVSVVDQNGKNYASVSNAIKAGATTITLLHNVTEAVTIPAGKTVTLDLAGYKLTNETNDPKKPENTIKADTITNNGTLTVTDSSEGKTGVVDNVSHGKAALSNEEGATATLNGGTFKRSKEDSTNGSNTFYTILNHGTMTINDPTKVESKNVNGSLSTFSSLIDNGWYSGSPNKDNAKLTINGGTFEGGNYIKNDSYGELTINGGSVKGSSAAVFSWNKATINGGEFSSEGNQVIWNGGVSVDKDPEGANVGQLTITGGTFTATDGQTIIAQHAKNLTDGQKNDVAVKVTGGTFKGALADDLVNAQISGGSFTVAPDASYIVAGSGLDKRDDGTYGVTKAVLVLDGSVQDGTLTVDVAKGAALTKADLLKLASVSVEGYTLDVSGDFDGLAAAIKDKDTSKSFEFTYTATKDGKNADTLTAKLAVKLTDSSVVTKPDATKTWKVTFVDGIDSTDDPKVEVKDGEAVAKPADPTLDGWKFVGWYTTLNDDGTVENEYDFSQPVKGDLTLYAGWVPAGSSDGTKPEEPKSDNKGNKELPQTGDTTNYAIPVALGVAGVVAVGGALVMRKRQQ